MTRITRKARMGEPPWVLRITSSARGPITRPVTRSPRPVSHFTVFAAFPGSAKLRNNPSFPGSKTAPRRASPSNFGPTTLTSCGPSDRLKLRVARSPKSFTWMLVTMFPKRSIFRMRADPRALAGPVRLLEIGLQVILHRLSRCVPESRPPPDARPPERTCRGRETSGSPDAGSTSRW